MNVSKYKAVVLSKGYLKSLFTGIIFLGVSLVTNYFAGIYAARSASNYVTDLLLDNLPVFDLDGLFVWGAIILTIFIFIILCIKPKYAPFVLKSIALFVFVRSIFVTLTHLGPFPDGINPPIDNPIRWFTFGADLFFSAHTGLPFLIALIFWSKKTIRYVFIATSIFFAAVVLLGHLHYSIDVFAAFFITYGINDMAKFLFKKDYGRIEQSETS